MSLEFFFYFSKEINNGDLELSQKVCPCQLRLTEGVVYRYPRDCPTTADFISGRLSDDVAAVHDNLCGKPVWLLANLFGVSPPFMEAACGSAPILQ